MKELEIKDRDKMEISVQKKQQKEKELVGKIIPHPGHTVWEINDETLEIQEAKFEHKEFKFGFKVEQQNQEIIVRNGFSYISALNKKSALKKHAKGENGSRLSGDAPMKLSHY